MQVDARAVGRVVVGVALVAVTVVAVVLIVAGIQKNSQIRSLQSNGVPVEATVTGCLGQLGGSGSNAAGYSCTVTYTVAGHGYQANLPGTGPVAAGSTVRGVVASNDPALFTTPAALAGEQPSAADLRRSRGDAARGRGRLPPTRGQAATPSAVCARRVGLSTRESSIRTRIDRDDDRGLPFRMAETDSGFDDDAVVPRPGLWQRFVELIRKPDDGETERPSLGTRLSGAVLKASDSGEHVESHPETVEELELAVKRADDKERLVGLIAAPLAGMIGVLVTGSLIANDPKATTATGLVNKAHVNPSLYLELGTVTVVLAAVMLAMAWWRKRLYLGIAMALYGLSIFNLRFWGFGLPFVFAGAWLMVRAYRLQQKLKTAREAAPVDGRGAPRASKRYTPPPGRPGTTRRGERKAG